MLERKAIEDFNRPRGQPKGVFLTNLVKGIKYCGISFNVWFKTNADGTASKILEYTSLVGAQKKKLLNWQVPSKLHKYLDPDTCASVCKIWTFFEEYYNFVSDFSLTGHAAGDVF